MSKTALRKNNQRMSFIKLFVVLYLFILTNSVPSLQWANAAASARASLPPDFKSLILNHQPYMNPIVLKSSYSWSFIKSVFPKAILDGETATYKKNGNETLWRLNKNNLITKVTFKFDISQWRGSEAEKRILRNYQSKLTSDVRASIPSETRTLTIQDESNHLEFDVLFPISDYKSPIISSVTFVTVGAK